jgi:hypothetical protein
MAIVNDGGGKGWLIQRNLERVAAAPAPADRADAVFPDVRLRLQKFKSRVPVPLGSIFGNSAHQFVRHVRRVGHSAAI